MKRSPDAFRIPSAQEIKAYRNPHGRRSPYIAGCLSIPAEQRYTEYTVDFQATHLPRGTYCCLGNWALDFSELKKYFTSVRSEAWCHGYAGFQKIADGRMISIMSIWDLYCKNASGSEITICAKRLYPESVIDGGRFWGEGTGARSSAPFAWEAKHWYRMHLKCIYEKYTTLAEQWVQDLETGKRTLLCRYDTGVIHSCFQGNMAIFLENYLPETAGEVRGMELCNARYREEATGQWKSVEHIHLTSVGGAPEYEGSYDFGVSGGRAWMITSGVGGDWFGNGKGKKGAWFPLG